MAVSPDLLPITAIGVGVVGRSPRLVGEAFVTLVLGLVGTCAAAAVVAFCQDKLDLLPSGFSLDDAATALGGLATVNHETIAVALVAGIAGMLALETRASAAVGVAVSVTTIPAAAYFGVAAWESASSGPPSVPSGCLGMNVLMMVVGASGTLAVQRALNRRAARSSSARRATG